MGKLLVVIDMQKDFVDGVLGTPEAQAIVTPMEEYIRGFEGDVVFTQDTHYEDYLQTQEGTRLPVEHCIENTEGWKIIDSLLNAKETDSNNNGIFCKNTFGSKQLGELVGQKKYDEVHLVGVCTGICVISNAVLIKTYAPETRVVVHKNLCACVTPESHETALKAMELLQMDIV